MYRTFNCGVGMLVCVAADRAGCAVDALTAQALQAWVVGAVAPGDAESASPRVRYAAGL